MATDSFTGTVSTELSSYNSRWSKQTGFAPNGLLGTTGTYAVDPASVGGDYVVYQYSGNPSSADYSVFADLKVIDASWTASRMGVIGRADAGAGTFYSTLQIIQDDTLHLYRWLNGLIVEGWACSHAMLEGVTETHELRMAGNQLSVYVDDVLMIGPITNGDITAAGKAGIVMLTMSSSGIDRASLDNFVDGSIAVVGFREAMPSFLGLRGTSLPATVGFRNAFASFIGMYGKVPEPTTEGTTGTGGIDPGDGLRRIVKPTGLLERAKPKTRTDERVDESREIQAEIAGRLLREFADENAALAIAQAAEIQATLTEAEITAEIGVLLRKKLRTQEDELLLLLLMAAAAC